PRNSDTHVCFSKYFINISNNYAIALLRTGTSLIALPLGAWALFLLSFLSTTPKDSHHIDDRRGESVFIRQKFDRLSQSMK
ncbi:MAG: hypothetical protein PVF37_22970, partial [Desulfobacterales bacterium]